jgi:hypothetical protein
MYNAKDTRDQIVLAQAKRMFKDFDACIDGGAQLKLIYDELKWRADIIAKQKRQYDELKKNYAAMTANLLDF